MFDEEDEEEDNGRQKVEVREDSISLDQVCDFLSDVRPFYSQLSLLILRRLDELLCRARGEVHGSDLAPPWYISYDDPTLVNIHLTEVGRTRGVTITFCICFVDISYKHILLTSP